MNPTIKCACGNSKAKEAQYCDTCWAWLPETAKQKVLASAKNLKSAQAVVLQAVTSANVLLNLHRRGRI
jgi:hypothetical protein